MKRALIILMGSLGDVVRGLSVADGLKEKFTGIKITWLVEPKCKGIVELSRSVDEVIVFNRVNFIKGFIELFPKLKGFDLVLDLQRHFKSGFFSWISGAPRRIGFHRDDSKECNWIFNNERIPYQGDRLNKYLHYQKFLEYLDIAPRKQSMLRDCELPDTLRDIKDKVVTVVMSTSWESKNWVNEGYEKLISKLIAENYVVILVGDRKQISLANLLAEKSKNIISLVGTTTLDELTAILKRSLFAVGPDSGPGHIAAAVQTPYISLFGPTSPERVAPYGFENLVIRGEIGCSPCYRRKCPGLDKLCMRLISVDAIMQKVDQYVEGKEKRAF